MSKATKSVHRVKDCVVSKFRNSEGEKNESDHDLEQGCLCGLLGKESPSTDKSTSGKKQQSVDNSDMDDSPTEEAPTYHLISMVGAMSQSLPCTPFLVSSYKWVC